MGKKFAKIHEASLATGKAKRREEKSQMTKKDTQIIMEQTCLYL
jgi:hypothetical protein